MVLFCLDGVFTSMDFVRFSKCIVFEFGSSARRLRKKVSPKPNLRQAIITNDGQNVFNKNRLKT